MKKRDVILDFTSLLDVTLIVIFFFVLFSHLDSEENKTVFFIIVLDDPPLDRAYSNIIMDDSGRIKISIKNIWNELGLCNLTNDINIGVKHTQNADDGDIYELVIN